MKVLEAWLRRDFGRGVMLTITKEGWRADAVVPDDSWAPCVQSSGGEDLVGLPDIATALASLDEALADEARALAKAGSKDG